MKNLSVTAGYEILKHYEKEIEVEYKKDNSPVTSADKAANNIIVQGLKSSFSHIPVLAEESVDNLSRLSSRFCFVVDPLDGTREYVKRNDEFTVNIAFVEQGRPIAGVIYVPVYKELYYAQKGIGAYSVIDGNEKRLKVSDRLGSIRLAKSRSFHAPELDEVIEKNKIENIIIAGSAYKGCLLARGDVEAYYRFGRTMEWDTAAMEILILEAGGIFSGMDGRVFNYNKENPENPCGFYALNRKENELKL
ncbi:MAG: 3'(2'),5'-bisphosphate nucleotidase CysQ [Clostridiaceae bacterium]|nr:3'(2'),5'-bisphosphate nucleotidase CysQ [Clostridiaceae bacterium]